MNRIRVAGLALTFCSSLAFAQSAGEAARPAGTSAPSAALTAFAREATIGGMSEVELGHLAVQKATDPAVKAFGQRMIDDHSRANSELQSIAANEGVSLPVALDAKQKKTYVKLAGLSGAAFDRAYIDDMVKDHKEDIAAFEKASLVPGESPIKAFAARTLPTLRDHLQMAEAAKASVSHGSAPAMH